MCLRLKTVLELFRNLRVTPRVIFISPSHPMKRKISNSSGFPTFKKQKMTTTKISLTARESQLRDLLLDVARYIDESKEIKEKIELRFAGGWVRDKLLNIQSHDVDTAINVMTGEDFGLKIKDYLDDAENLKKHSLEEKDRRKLHLIEANPEKSKHLATATTNIFGFDVDFVNLRKEEYTDPNSRNPQMQFGTALEDAERRDATINALFYNLHSDLVEDFTGGLEDLEKRRIRTPLEPEKTFEDDPLRVLRLIRFASRLNFAIDPDAEKWMGDEKIKEALKVKISRERVGVELEKMLKGNDPRSSLNYIEKLGLYSTIFTIPNVEGIPTPSSENWSIVCGCLAELKASETPGSIYQTLVRSDDSRYLAWILASLTPWANTLKPEKVGAKASEREPFITDIARKGIVLDSKNCNLVSDAFNNHKHIIEVKNAIKGDESWVNERDTLGMIVREWGKRTNWKLHTLFALLAEVMNQSSADYQMLFPEWQGFLDHLEKMELMDVASQKQPLTGTRLAKDLNVKPGAWMKGALDVCMQWQLRNKDSDNIEEAIEEVRKRRDELKIPKSN